MSASDVHGSGTGLILQQRLSQALTPSFLEILDEGAQHIGHAEEGSGHFAIRIASPLFQNKSLLECHRMVYTVLGNIVGTAIHALRIEVVPNTP